MEERNYLIEHLTAAQLLAREAGDVVLSYLINMGLMHAQRLDTSEAEAIAEFVDRVA